MRSTKYLCSITFMLLFGLLLATVSFAAPKLGYTIHFTGLRNSAQAIQVIGLAKKAGADVVNVVPPAHIWESTESLSILKTIFDEAEKQQIGIVITSIDADAVNGQNYLHQRVFSDTDIHVDRPEIENIIGNDKYTKWMQEETVYYGRTFGKHPALVGFNVGIYSNPFQYFFRKTAIEQDYIFIQKTAGSRNYWIDWLSNKLGRLERINQEYQSTFATITDMTIPIMEDDPSYPLTRRANYDFLRCVNEWFINNYKTNHDLWHQYSDKPFIIQVNSEASNILAQDAGIYAALDVNQWFASADAVGLSLYTNSKQDDLGLGQMQNLLNLAGMSGEMGKPLFILESGHRLAAPELGIYLRELSSRIALPSQPVLINYEYFQEFQLSKKTDARYMVNAAGRVFDPSFDIIRKNLTEVKTTKTNRLTPYLYIIEYNRGLRDDESAGKFYSLMQDAGTFVPIRWCDYSDIAFIPAKSLVLIAPTWKTSLSDTFVQQFLTLAKRREWHVMLDEQTYPTLQTLLGQELKGATIDIAGFMQDTSSDRPGLGFGKALVEFYEKQLLNVPNMVSPDIGLAVLPGPQDLQLFIHQPTQDPIVVHLDSWNPATEKQFRFRHLSRTGQPVVIQLFPGKSATYSPAQIKVSMLSPKSGQLISMPVKSSKDSLQFLADHNTQFVFSLKSATDDKQPEKTAPAAKDKPKTKQPVKKSKK